MLSRIPWREYGDFPLKITDYKKSNVCKAIHAGISEKRLSRVFCTYAIVDHIYV